MDFGIAFAPLVPVEVLWAALAAVALVAGLLLFIRSRGAPLRSVNRFVKTPHVKSLIARHVGGAHHTVSSQPQRPGVRQEEDSESLSSSPQRQNNHRPSTCSSQ